MNKDLWIGVALLVMVFLVLRWRRAKAAPYVQGQFNNVWARGPRVFSQRNYAGPGWRGHGTWANGGRVGGRTWANGAPYVAV
jgi:hypothetical protein